VKYLLEALSRKRWRRINYTESKTVKKNKRRIRQPIKEKTKEGTVTSWSGNYPYLM